MKIYKLVCNEIDKEQTACLGSYVSPRNKRWEKFYATKELAERTALENMEAAIKLIGLFPRVEFVVHEIEVTE